MVVCCCCGCLLFVVCCLLFVVVAVAVAGVGVVVVCLSKLMITIIGGDFTRSWLSLPLSHSAKVKGGQNAIFWVTDFRTVLIKLYDAGSSWH